MARSVLHVTQALYPYLMGGSALQCHEMANSQVLRGDDVEVHTIEYGRRESPEQPKVLYRLKLHRRIPFVWDFMGTAGNPFAPGISRAVRRSKADVVHLHSHLFFTSWFGASGARRSKKAVVLTVHGVRAVRGRITNALQEAWLRTIGRKTLRMSHLVLCLTENDAQEIERYGVSRNKIRVVFNAYDPAVFFPGVRNPLKVIWVGRFVPEKGLTYLVEAWKRVHATHPMASLELIGDGPDRSSVEAQVKAAGLDENVTFRGNMNQQDVASALRASGVFVLPSIQEGFPKALLEAMASGLPAVTIQSLASVVGTGGILMAPRDVRALANAIESLLDDPESAERYGRAGARRAVEKYSWPALIDVTDGLYQEAIDANTP